MMVWFLITFFCWGGLCFVMGAWWASAMAAGRMELDVPPRLEARSHVRLLREVDHDQP